MAPESGEKQALRKLARNRRFEELEASLLAEIEGCSIDREEVVAILNLCVHRDEEEKAEALMWMILSAWTERRGPGSGLELLRGLAPLLPKSAALRGEADALYRATRADHPGLANILRGTVLNEATPLGDGMRQADALLRFAPGSYFRERRGKVAGKALGVRESGDALLAQMEGKERAFDLRAVCDLEPLPEDDVRVLLGFFPDRVAEAAEQDPAGLVERVLRSHGPLLSYRELRAVLTDLVPGGFAAFWNEASPRIRRSPWIEVSAGSQPTFELRRAALSHEARFRREFAETGPGLPRLLATLTYLEEAGEHAAQEPALTALLSEALRAEAGSPDPSIALGSLALLDRLGRFRPEDAGAALPLPEMGDPAAVVSRLVDPELTSAVLALVKARRPDSWVDFYAAAFPACSMEVCEEIGRELRAAGREDALLKAVGTVLSAPSRFTGALLFIWKDTAAGGLPVSTGGPDRAALLAQVFLAADRAARAGGPERQTYQRIRSILSSRDFEAMRSALASTDLEGAKKVADTLPRCIGFSDDFRGQLTMVLTEVHPKLFARDIPPWELTEVIWTTQRGLDRKRKELDRLVNEVLPEIATAIGHAAAEGDLSENAEYKGNLERRDRMTERANTLQAELAKARVIPKEMVGTREVTVGSRIKVRDLATEELREFSFLGPWDADAEKGCYSYRATLGLAFMGKKPDESVGVEVDGLRRHFQILEISSAIA